MKSCFENNSLCTRTTSFPSICLLGLILKSFASDLLNRESNVILLDEFDKFENSLEAYTPNKNIALEMN